MRILIVMVIMISAVKEYVLKVIALGIVPGMELEEMNGT
jgi:hypothetical protein